MLILLSDGFEMSTRRNWHFEKISSVFEQSVSKSHCGWMRSGLDTRMRRKKHRFVPLFA